MTFAKRVLLLVLASGAIAWGTEHSGCSLVHPIERVASTAAGKWFVIGSITVRERPQEKSPTTACGGFNHVAPCSCSYFEISSNLPEPFIEEYNVTAYGFNTILQTHDFQDFSMKLANQILAIFNAQPKVEGADHFTIRGLATDDHKTYMVLDVCSQSLSDEYIWILSKTPELSAQGRAEVFNTLQKNNLETLRLNLVYQGADVCLHHNTY